MNGYIEKIIISQIQLQYNLPTIIPGRNDTFVIRRETAAGSDLYIYQQLSIPYGFYSPDELAAVIAVKLNLFYGDGQFTVFYRQAGGPTYPVGFEWISSIKRFDFVGPEDLRTNGFNEPIIASHLKFCKLIGMDKTNSLPALTQISNSAPDFLYTPYIDIVSDALTNYQRLKDTDSSTIRRKGLIARMYLSGVGNPQVTSVTYYSQGLDPEDPQTTSPIIMASEALGSKPFVLTFDLNSPKVVNWTPDTAINSLDFELRDCYGDLLFVRDTSVADQNGTDVFNTEFQMTLLCVEKNY